MMFWNSLINVIFPSLCLNCNVGVESGNVICEKCFKGIPLNQTLFCEKCRARLADNKKICHKDSEFVLGSAANYDNDAVKNLIHGLKFQYLRSAASPLAELLIKYAEGLGLSFQDYSVVPVPLSRERLRKRGFNQSQLIAEIFSKHFGLPIAADILARIKNTKPQSDTKNILERKENMEGCFAVKNPELVCGKNIILVDDVITSGATIREAVSSLKSAGAKRVLALAVAKA